MNRLLTLLSIALLSACASAPKPDPAFAPISASAYPRPAEPSNGAIFREGSGGLSLFADRRAFYPGDLITITLAERTVAQTRKATSSSKTTGVSMAAPSVLGAPVTINGRDPLSTSINSENTFEGTGDSDQSNSLSGSVTVTVVDRLPNGNLVVRGEKLIRLNRSDEVVQIQGIVRAADIQTDNSVPSTRVADARIVYTGRGELAQANAQGWLSRFFNSVVMP
ncbi:flagellar basal body L-ring protein FlgH [Pseudomarimonas arenosa]|uniref:Flagellar L-ring protein n=1 Tax=Pseudomarimonas arenosa TaxID=2774145 RepID=A0AAW3ZHZ9_9GAMM|nr:flagellar basal body L-ring protein FlgH [Pseudomarimonas arenosa]MBD8524757.1 flagellar basal body L-ring protein FlgH [Pseudomarimonas arenosa]